MPYILTVLADRLGLRETPAAGVRGDDETYPEVSVSAVTKEGVGGGSMVPSARLPADFASAVWSADGCLATRRAFWGRMAVETGIGDLGAYCRACGRPPRYDDLARSVEYVRERQARARGDRGER